MSLMPAVCTNVTDEGDVCGDTKYCERCFAWLTANIEAELPNDESDGDDTVLPHQEEICVESSDDDMAPADTKLETPPDLQAVPAPSLEIWLETLADDALADEPPADADEPPAKMQRIEEKEEPSLDDLLHDMQKTEPEAEPPGKKLRIVGKKAH